jgi:hypothetical protein
MMAVSAAAGGDVREGETTSDPELDRNVKFETKSKFQSWGRMMDQISDKWPRNITLLMGDLTIHHWKGYRPFSYSNPQRNDRKSIGQRWEHETEMKYPIRVKILSVHVSARTGSPTHGPRHETCSIQLKITNQHRIVIDHQECPVSPTQWRDESFMSDSAWGKEEIDRRSRMWWSESRGRRLNQRLASHLPQNSKNWWLLVDSRDAEPMSKNANHFEHP